LQNAEHWFNLDGQMATAAAGGSSLVLSLPGQTVTYSLAGTQLQRTEGSSTIILARDISSLSFSVNSSLRLVSMDIAASISGRTEISEQNVYKVHLRPVQQ